MRAKSPSDLRNSQFGVFFVYDLNGVPAYDVPSFWGRLLLVALEFAPIRAHEHVHQFCAAAAHFNGVLVGRSSPSYRPVRHLLDRACSPEDAGVVVVWMASLCRRGKYVLTYDKYIRSAKFKMLTGESARKTRA